MSDIMRPVPFNELLIRMFSEYSENGSIFGIPAKQFYKKQAGKNLDVWGENCETPVGPAAGPHTQLAQNIICSWLAGGRFMELKTVQKLDTLEIAKPCIDAEDECYNTEWSTEFTLVKAYDEYLKAWIALHLLEEVFQPIVNGGDRSFVFNMSVGYDLAGIQTAPMQKYIDDMLDASKHENFKRYLSELEGFISQGDFTQKFGIELPIMRMKHLCEKVSPHLTQGVTLSTMHGCPPTEIEKICQYMIEDKQINTFVKLNPTLLGFKRVRDILDNSGFTHIVLSEESFSHDLQLPAAKAMLHRLRALGAEKGIGFGVKLTNTLGTLNKKGRLPDKEMYMSGRALFPLSINVALELSREFDGELPISYSGGASKFNIQEIFETGIRPITMATDLLKPGGYLRLADCAIALEKSDAWDMDKVDLVKLEALAAKSLVADYTQKEWRGPEDITVEEALPISDCSVAPCVTACPISQDIPEYIRLMGDKKYTEALELIYSRNALPSITGHICDHQCQYNCTRRDYEGALKIREMKKIALDKGWDDYKAKWHQPVLDVNKHPVAVLGAGPAGLSAAYFMAKAGHPVTIFEKEANAGGVVKNIIPHFRIPAEVIEHDIKFVTSHGVNIEYGCDANLTLAILNDSGFKYICLGIGANKGNPIKLDGDNTNIHKSLEFLSQFNQGDFNDADAPLGKHVAVVGAGNTAMDSARAALKVNGVNKVTVLYRRTLAEMPAYKEEYEEAVEDGVEFMFLTNPEAFHSTGKLIARVMELGEKDAKGRRRPVPTDKTVELDIDALITAVGEQSNCEVLSNIGIPMGKDGWPIVSKETGETGIENVYLIGDANTGPSSIVAAISGGRKAASSILTKVAIDEDQLHVNSNVDVKEIYSRKGEIQIQLLSSADDKDAFVEQEAKRCLECSYVCSKCVDVCPNRANISLPIPGFKDQLQVLHIDAYCNECGNCAQFCPWQGKPYQDKFTIYNLADDFKNSKNSGFYVEGNKVLVRKADEIYTAQLSNKGVIELPELLNDEAKMINYVVKHHSYLLGHVEL